MEPEEEWPPPQARARAGLWRAEGHLERGEYAQAARALDDVLPDAAEPQLVLGLRHLAAAGWRAQEGEHERARRQLDHAQRRLAPFLDGHDELDVATLVARVASEVGR
jgi:hypothetical protein